jgi:hypothetical protein
MDRRLYGIAAIAVVVGGGSLVLANDVTSGAAHRGAMVVLFLTFLAATLTLLAMSVASAERIADEELATVTLRTRRRPVRRAVGRVTRGVATSTEFALTWAARTSSAGAVQVRRAARTTMDDLRRARTSAGRPEQHETRGMGEMLRRAGHATLVALGLPPEEDEVPPRPWMAQPLVGPRPRPAHVPGPRRPASFHSRTRTGARLQRKSLISG